MRRYQLFLIVQLLSFWPVWRWYIARVSDSSDEPWGVVALATALLFLCLRTEAREPRRVPLVAAGVVTLCYVLSFSFAPPLFRALLAITSLAITASAMGLGRSLHLGILGLFVLSLPIIASLQFYGGYPVRVLTALLAAKLISFSGHNVIADGTNLLWFGELVSVDAPCAGIRMLWTGLYLNFTLACFSNLSNFATWFAYSCSLIAIFLGNVLRATLLFFGESGILDYPAWAHRGIGLFVFACIATLIVFSHKRIQRRFT